MSFSVKLTKLRKINGFTQETFAKEVGVSRQSVYKWETGQSYPEVPKLLKVARTFSVTVDDLLNDDMDIDENGVAVPREVIAFEKAQKKAEWEAKRAETKAAKTAAAEKPAGAEQAPEAPVAKKATPAPIKKQVEEEKKGFGRLFGSLFGRSKK